MILTSLLILVSLLLSSAIVNMLAGIPPIPATHEFICSWLSSTSEPKLASRWTVLFMVPRSMIPATVLCNGGQVRRLRTLKNQPWLLRIERW